MGIHGPEPGRARGLCSPAGSPCSKHGSGSRDEVPLPLRCRNFNRAGHGFQASESTAPANAEISGQLVHPASGLLNIRKSRSRDIRSAMRWSRILGYTFFGGALATVLAITQLALDLSHGWWIAAVLGAPALLLTAKLVLTENFVDDCVDRIVDAPLDSLHVYSRTFPKHRYYDFYRAAERFAAKFSFSALETTHSAPLDAILNRSFIPGSVRTLQTPPSIAIAIGPEETAFVPSEGFWLKNRGPAGICIVRVRTEPYGNDTILEVAAHRESDPTEVMGSIVDAASEQSIYKGRTLELQFQKQSADDFENTIGGHLMDVRFLQPLVIADSDIVLPQATRSLLQRTVLDFYAHRRSLKDLGVPGKRGLLFYGPPGTGKTYTTKYLASRLTGITTIVVSGTSLGHIRAVCNVARALQPALVVMEDVDLVFNSRETNFTGALLGDLMDELDGFARDDEILYVLTTNAIDRVEAAIKDRPGRISQCVHFGAPGRDLRRMYLASLLAPYTAHTADLHRLAGLTEGGSQAFLKELVHRAVQVAFERLGAEERLAPRPATLPLDEECFTEAIREMRSGAGRAGEAIIGFRVERASSGP